MRQMIIHSKIEEFHIFSYKYKNTTQILNRNILIFSNTLSIYILIIVP